MKTINGTVEPITCSHCHATTEQSVDRARQAGWRIGWHPGHPTWCPDCFGASVRRARHREEQHNHDMDPLWGEDDA